MLAVAPAFVPTLFLLFLAAGAAWAGWRVYRFVRSRLNS